MRIIEIAAVQRARADRAGDRRRDRRVQVGGRPVLRPTPDAALDERDVRLTACYPLVPYSNRIRDARLRFGGRDYALARNFGAHPHAIHGVGWQRAWSVAEASATRARLVARHDARGEDAAAWPWPFRRDAGVPSRRIVGAPMRPTRRCSRHADAAQNRAREAFPFGLGWHPFFPKTRRRASRFDARARLAATTRRSCRCERIADSARMAIRSARARSTRSRSTTCSPAGAASATLDDARRGIAIDDRAPIARARYLVVYAPAGRDFVAVEPVTHETDAFNRAAAGASSNRHARRCAPGAAFSCTMRIAASAARLTGRASSTAPDDRRQSVYLRARHPREPRRMPGVVDRRAGAVLGRHQRAVAQPLRSGDRRQRRDADARVDRQLRAARRRRLRRRAAQRHLACDRDGTLERKVADAPYDPSQLSLQRRPLRSAGPLRRRHDEREARCRRRRAVSARRRLHADAAASAT